MRLTNGTPEIASFDIANRFTTGSGNVENGYRQPTMWMMEGSVDGARWDVLTNMSWTTALTTGKTWYSDKTSCYGTRSGRKWQDGKSFPIRGRPETPVSFNVLGNCESVSVAPGATLEKQGNEEVVISNLRIDAAGFGTIDGFAFGSEGSLTVDNAVTSGTIDIPGTFSNCTNLGNIKKWTLSAGGRKYVVHKVTTTGVCIGSCGTSIYFR